MDEEAIISGFELDGGSRVPLSQEAHQVESGNWTSLEKYTRDKLDVTHQIRLLENLLRSRESKERASQCHDLMVKLAEDRFTLAVVGQFKRGKSSLMNALIERELLPTGVLPLTSAITILRYGPRERLVVSWQDSGFDCEEPITALNDYVTEEGNPGNRRKARAVYVEVPSPFLRRGLEFVDTPGVGSAIEANTATTYEFVPNCDAVVFVTGVDAPMTEAEFDFLRRLRRYVGKVFCVVNKIDLLEEPQRSKVLGFAIEQLCNALGSSKVSIFPVSSRLALSMNGADEGGVGALRNELGHFLSKERTSVLLKAIIDRALRLLAIEHEDILLSQRSAAMSGEMRRRRAEQIRSRFDEIRQKISAMNESLVSEIMKTVIDSAIAQLDERIRLGIVGLADGLAALIAAGNWESAKSFVSVLTRSVSDAAQHEMNEWLNNNAQAVDAKLQTDCENMRGAIFQLLAKAEAGDDLLAGGKRQFDEFQTTLDKGAAELLRINSTAWTDVPPWRIRYMPISLVRRSLRKWLHDVAEVYGQRLRTKAIGLLDKFQESQVRTVMDGLIAHIKNEGERLIAAILSPAAAGRPEDKSLLAKQLDRVRHIEDALIGLLRNMGERLPTAMTERSARISSESESASAEFAPALLTVDLLEKYLRAGGCAVCRHLASVLFDFFAKWQYWMATDDITQRQFARERGFCPLHTWQLASLSSPRGLSAGYPRIVERLREDLKAIRNNGDMAKSISALAASTKTCLVCRTLSSVEEHCVNELRELLDTEAGRRSYDASSGICLKHLPSLLDTISDPATKRFLVDVAAAHLGTLSEDMQSFALKQEATRRELINSNEDRAVWRALDKIVGIKSLCFPWHFDEVR